MERKICYIYTGGTIGMTATDAGYAPKKNYLREAMEAIEELQREEMPRWDLVEFDPLLDSSNITVNEWNRIGRAISERNYDYDGFVVLHGTDTMAYTASALSFMLEGLSKPVVLTGSQIPIGELRSDARDNIITAAMIAAEGRCPEVSLYFAGRLLRGNRTTKISSDEMLAFDTPNLPELANAGIQIRYNEKIILPAGENFAFVPFVEDVPIAVLKVFPGIQFGLFEGIMTESLKGMVLEAFGAGNIPQYDKKLIPIVQKAVRNGTVIIVCTQCLRGSVQLGTYETSGALKAAGALSGYDMTAEAAVAKLYYLFSKGYDAEKIRELFETNLCGELTKTETTELPARHSQSPAD